jgi:glycosyltransferase involved in cell wall biosynthesis
MKLSIIIPVFNEKNTILELLRKVEAVDLNSLDFKKEIIIVDDCSTDGTREILDSLGDKYKIIYHSKNQGKGAAIKTGLKWASGDYIIIQDADLEYDPKDYKTLLEYALKNNAEVVYGSRNLNPENKHSNLLYYLGGIFFTWLTNILYGIRITDESTGYKMFKTDLLKTIPLKSKRFEFCPEITAKIAKRGIKIHEVPINYSPRPVKAGKKISWWKDGLKTAWTLIKYRFID